MKKLLALFLLVPSCVVVGVSFVSPAYACGPNETEAVQPAAQKAVFYTATHPAVRCMWRWGDELTQVSTENLSIAQAQQKYQTLKKQSASKHWFKDYGNWFVYHENGVWYAVGYYTQGQQPFVKLNN
jgi:hypothetical protein